MCFKLFLCVFLSRKLYSVLYNIILIFVFFRFVYFIKKNMCFVCFVCGKNVFLSKINTALKPDRFRKTWRKISFLKCIFAGWVQFVKKSMMIVLGTCETRKKQLLMPWLEWWLFWGFEGWLILKTSFAVRIGNSDDLIP